MKMKERDFFVVANSFAAPFVSDQSTHFVAAYSPDEALEKLADQYAHPCGLYAAACYESADAYHKGEAMLGRWLSYRAQATADATVIRSISPGVVEVDGKIVHTEPGGCVVYCADDWEEVQDG